MGYTAEMERDFVKEDLGPTLAKFGYSDVKLMMLDDQRHFVPEWADKMLSDRQTAKYVSGIALHWYNEAQTSPDVLTAAHKKLVYTVSHKIIWGGVGPGAGGELPYKSDWGGEGLSYLLGLKIRFCYLLGCSISKCPLFYFLWCF